jgi:DNA-binding response OmpR family regulator
MLPCKNELARCATKNKLELNKHTTMARILLVDDDENFRKMLELILRHEQHAVTTAADGNEAMRLVQDNTFDLIITDLLMPGKEGIETIMELRRKFPALKFIAMSGGGFTDPAGNLAVCLKLGVAQTLTKPFSREELLAAVASVLSQ